MWVRIFIRTDFINKRFKKELFGFFSENLNTVVDILK